MTYKEFVRWCNIRTCDGCWTVMQAIRCLGAMSTINSLPFWKREKEWQKIRGKVEKDVSVIEKKMKRERGGD